MIKTEQFTRLFPGARDPDKWVEALNEILPRYEITTPLRIAAFLSQCGHESEGFTHLVENLNYSAAALTATWSKRFPKGVAEEYARQPERIGNRAYADRMGNGPESSGDGYRYRGRGVIQLTGKDTYLDFARSVGKSLDEVVLYLETRQGAIESACWFWKSRGINHAADNGDVMLMTKKINGGLNGYEDRKIRFAKAQTVFSSAA